MAGRLMLRLQLAVAQPAEVQPPLLFSLEFRANLWSGKPQLSHGVLRTLTAIHWCGVWTGVMGLSRLRSARRPRKAQLQLPLRLSKAMLKHPLHLEAALALLVVEAEGAAVLLRTVGL